MKLSVVVAMMLAGAACIPHGLEARTAVLETPPASMSVSGGEVTRDRQGG